MRNKIAFGLALALVILWGATVMAAGGIDTDWNVLASGGGRVTMATYTLDNTVGQAVVGIGSSGTTQICTGFWCHNQARQAVYLPLLLRS